MRAKRGPVVLCCCLLGISALTGCGGPAGEDRETRTHTVVADSEWAWLQQARRDLDAKRAGLTRAEAEARKSGKDPAAVPAVQTLSAGVRARTDELRRRLLGFINDNPPPAGEKPAGRALEAIRLKSDEDILIAREHMEQGGDYRRAIDIYEAALAVDPDNPRLKQEMERAQTRRYMTEERFARVQAGMTADQVRALLGSPNVNDIRDYPERGVTGWFYARDPRGGAAAVWFKKNGDRQIVYQTDFDALPAQPRP
ncbi:MAG TPA: outer membrane protein assembly factor BamE [Thermoanaerobaculia bacterium]|nr:outer membrane protein assembly factor BamE [Thermoanaerobaculia bacterium]